MNTHQVIPETMIAALIAAPGATESFALRELPVASTFAAEVLVRVEYSSVNPIDVKTRAGGGASAGLHFPAILGNDFSGVVVRAAYESHPLQPGDRVYGMVGVPRYPGTSAQYVAVSTMSVAPLPTTLDFRSAAAVPLAAMTAWGAAIEVAQITAGQRVLIHAGAGGVGHFAVQFAALRGAHVITTASAHNAAFLRELGAAEVVDYHEERFEKVIAPVDVVIDLIGNAHDHTATRSLEILKPGGIIVNVPSGTWPTMIAETAGRDLTATTFKLEPNASTLRQITELIEQGQVRVHVAAEYELTDLDLAYQAVAAGHTRGKIVVRLPG